MDLVVAINRGAARLLRSDTPTEHRSTSLRLEAHAALACGARVEVSVAGKRQVMSFGAKDSFCRRHAPELIFGMRSAKYAERVRVTWLDGTVTAGRVTITHAR